MAHMREEELYDLMLEVTGVNQYENKRNESMKLIEDTSNNNNLIASTTIFNKYKNLAKDKQSIRDLLKEVQSKFEDLKVEKDSFQNYEERENTAKWY